MSIITNCDLSHQQLIARIETDLAGKRLTKTHFGRIPCIFNWWVLGSFLHVNWRHFLEFLNIVIKTDRNIIKSHKMNVCTGDLSWIEAVFLFQSDYW